MKFTTENHIKKQENITSHNIGINNLRKSLNHTYGDKCAIEMRLENGMHRM